VADKAEDIAKCEEPFCRQVHRSRYGRHEIASERVRMARAGRDRAANLGKIESSNPKMTDWQIGHRRRVPPRPTLSREFLLPHAGPTNDSEALHLITQDDIEQLRAMPSRRYVARIQSRAYKGQSGGSQRCLSNG